MKNPSARSGAALLAMVGLVLAACDSPAPTEPMKQDVKPLFDVISQTYTSGSNVDTWNAIVPPAPQDPNWPTTICVSNPAVGLNDPRWTNPHKAFVVNGAAFQGAVAGVFSANWINAWPSFEWFGLTSQYGGPQTDPVRQQSWTKYSTTVSGNGDFVLYLVADNCSWVYITDMDGSNARLVGVQLKDPRSNPMPPITYPVTLNGDHKLVFLVFDGGGQSGGMFKLQTNTNITFPDTDGDGLTDVAETNIHHTNPNNPDTDGDGISDGAEVAAGTDPLVVNIVDADHDGLLDNVDNCPNAANADQADLDGDHIGDACDSDIDGDGVANTSDAFPTDPAESVDSDGDGHGNNSDAFPTDASEWKDSDGDGHGDNSDVFPNNASEWADSDHDGIGDNADAFDTSNMSPAVMVGTCNTGVANKHLGNGTWFNDLIGAAQSSAANHGAFVSAVSNLADGWKKSGLISGQQQGAIVSCAARTK